MKDVSDRLIKLVPTLLYFGLCAIIFIFDFNIWMEGSSEYEQIYVIPIVFSVVFLILLIFILRYIKTKKELTEFPQDISYRHTWILFIIYMAVIWFPRQFMIWKFGITYEKIPLIYLIVTQIVLVEGIYLTEFGLKRESLLKNMLIGCLIALIDISIMTIFNVVIPVLVAGSGVLSNLELFDIYQLITFPWQLIAVGISEELIFRGYFFTKFRKSGKSFWHSAFITSFVFMIFHVPWLITSNFMFDLDLPYTINLPYVIYTFSFALVCCALYEKTNSLTAPIVYHAFSNSITTFLIINVGPNPVVELLISIIAFFNYLLITLIAPWICKLFKFDRNLDKNQS